MRDISTVFPGMGPVKIIRENQVKQITVEVDIIIGGLAMEMLVALFLMPCMYVFATRRKSRP